jgi:hypothetical protein
LSSSSAPTSGPITIGSVAWFGDSIAYDAAAGLGRALEASGLSFSNSSFAGESLTDNLLIDDEESWLHKRVPKALAGRDEDLVVWQLSMWDYGAPVDVKLDTMTWFIELALANHDAVLFVIAPPAEDLANEVGRDELEQSAQTVAARYPDGCGSLTQASCGETTTSGSMRAGSPCPNPMASTCARWGWLATQRGSRSSSPPVSKA